MPELRKNGSSFGYGWAPRALAILSCTLALLAAQPAKERVAGGAQPTVSRQAEMGEKAVPSLASRAARERVIMKDRREDGILAGTGRLHILATLEIFQRLLRAELAPVEGQVALALFWEPACVDVLAPALAARDTGHLLRNNSTPPPTERAFAIKHFLLAPPIV